MCALRVAGAAAAAQGGGGAAGRADGVPEPVAAGLAEVAGPPGAAASAAGPAAGPAARGGQARGRRQRRLLLGGRRGPGARAPRG